MSPRTRRYWAQNANCQPISRYDEAQSTMGRWGRAATSLDTELCASECQSATHPSSAEIMIGRYLELKETGVIEKFDKTIELLGPTSKFTAFRLLQQCLAPQVDFLGRTLDPSASTAGFFARFDRKVEDTVAECTSQGVGVSGT